MDSAAWKPHGMALLDYFQGDTSAHVVVHGEDGETEVVPISAFFRGPAEFSALEEAALDLCRGRVLDAGGGAGCHSLVLQEQELSVCAVDIAPEAVEVMRRRGVRDARCADLFLLEAGPFDTILMMMNGIGVVGDLPGLDRFLVEARRLLRPDGQILLDSYDPNWTEDADAGASPTAGGRAGRYIGEMCFQLEYKGRKGPPLSWLFVDAKVLAERAVTAGWSCEVIWQEEEGHYLARLTRTKRGIAPPGITRDIARGDAGPGSRSGFALRQG